MVNRYCNKSAKRSQLFRATQHWFHVEDPDAVHLLLEAGIDVNAQDKQGRTVMHRVAIARATCQRPSYQRTVELLLDYGADVTIQAKSGLTSADMAKTM